MASQKEKYLSSAQKFLQKGQLERAIRDYEQVVAADPKDLRHRQKLAELLARCNRNEDALREYQTIAAHYEESGFYLKAIAVYKQIQRIDPRNIDVTFTLAALNEKQGLIGNALSEYKNIFIRYEKEGHSAEACNVLEKMHAVDPGNVDIQLKLAETYYASGLHDKAYAEYAKAAISLKNQGKDELHDRVCTRIKTLFPERKEFIIDMLEQQIRKGTEHDAVPVLTEMLQKDPENLKLLSLLADAQRIQGKMDDTKKTLDRLLRYHPSDNNAKQTLISCFLEEGDFENSLSILERYAPDLISAGLHANLEKFYSTLQNQAPYDLRILEGLKTLYEAEGDQAKLADVKVSLNILSGNVSDGQSEFAGNSGEGSCDGFSVEGLPGVTEVEFAVRKDAGIPFDGNRSDDTGISEVQPEVLNSRYSEAVPFGGDGNDFDPYAISLEDLVVIPETGECGERVYPVQPTWRLAGGATNGVSEPESDPEVFNPDSLFLDMDKTLLEVEFEEETVVPAALALEQEPPELLLEEDIVEEQFGMGGVLDSLALEVGRDFVKEDTETHFNLGIAYKEMGLYEEAMKEFKAAAVDPERTVDSLILQGICLRDTGDFTQAEGILKAGIHVFGHDAEKSMNLNYELGLLYELSGRKDAALRVFRDVFAANPGFRDTARKITKLHGSENLLDFSDIDEGDIELEV